MCFTCPKKVDLGTGVVFRGVLRNVAKSPESRTASGGVESIRSVGQYKSLRHLFKVSILRNPRLARRKSSETVTVCGIDEAGLSTDRIIGIGAVS